jgi:hypothetical protein
VEGTMMKKYWMNYAISLLLLIILVAHNAIGDGGLVWHVDYEEHMYLPEQKAVLFWDGTNETMILSSKLRAENATGI